MFQGSQRKRCKSNLIAVLPHEYGMLVSGIDVVLVRDILAANYLQLAQLLLLYNYTHGTSLSL